MFLPIPHVFPTYPSTHSQSQKSIPSIQVPPFSHGLDAQSSMSKIDEIFYNIPLIAAASILLDLIRLAPTKQPQNQCKDFQNFSGCGTHQ